MMCDLNLLRKYRPGLETTVYFRLTDTQDLPEPGPHLVYENPLSLNS